MIRHTLLSITLAGLVACAGSDGADGAAGANGAAGASSLVTITDEPAGANCAQGGHRVDVGLDDNGDGALGTEEIDDTTYVCNGAGVQTLVTSTSEPAGANCASGGQRIDIGTDDDGDKVLDPEEVETTSYVCNGADAVSQLVDVVVEAAGANCTAGGYRIDRGFDDDHDATLDPEEVDGSSYLCHGQDGTDGAQTLLAISTEPAGANCADGGQQVDYGSDDDADNFLDAAEIDGTAYVCNGAQGTEGLSSLVRVLAEPAGANCATGGRRIDNGLDANRNNVLDTAEITGTSYVCNGANGSLVDVTTEPAGANCEAGGFQLDYGIDNNGNGVLEASEIDGTDYVCHGISYQGLQIFTANGTFTPPPGVTSFRVLVVGGGGGGPGSHWNGGGSGHVRVGAFNVSSPVSITVGGGGIGGQAGNQFPGTDGGASSFGAFLSAAGGQGGWYRQGGDPVAGDGGSGGGGAGNSGCGGAGGTAGSNGVDGCTYTGSLGGNFDSLASLVIADVTAGAGGAAGVSSHGGGGGGGGVRIDGAGGPGAAGAQSFSARGGAGYGGGGGAGGYNGTYAVGGNGASGVVYVEW